VSYLLDTNVISELRRPEKASPNLLKWAAGISVDKFYLSAISIMEIKIGVLSLERKDRGQGLRIREWFERQVLSQFWHRILPVDVNVAQICAELHVPNRVSERDALIAATALVRDFFVVTRNVKDFQATGVKLVDPWS
jgi:toxin FitB